MEKILTFIIYNHKLLLLLGSDKAPQFHESFWYTTTGACEDIDLTLEDTVRREVKEETNLELDKVIDLKWSFEYASLGNHCLEHAFISYAKTSEVILNKESIDYRWCDLDEFLDLIKWYDDKQVLKEKIEIYI